MSSFPSLTGVDIDSNLMSIRKTRPELMKELNSLLGVDMNWGRLSLLDLNRLVKALRERRGIEC